MSYWRNWPSHPESDSQSEPSQSVPTHSLQPATKLHPVTLYEFQTEHLRGRFNGASALPGIEIYSSGEGAALTPADGRLMHLAHYFSSAFTGPEAAQNVNKYEELDGGILKIYYSPTEEWPLNTLISYSLAENDSIDVGFRFRFQQDMADFEAHVISSFSNDSASSHIHLDGEWIHPALREKQICFIARDETAMKIIEDGRWHFLIAQGYHLILDERGYDYPVLVRLEEKNGWALVHMLMTDECPAFSICSTPLKHGFSLLGRDVKYGEEIVCHARLAYGQFPGLEGIIPLYHQFVREVREGKVNVPEL